jgi:hypothetical protein
MPMDNKTKKLGRGSLPRTGEAPGNKRYKEKRVSDHPFKRTRTRKV